MIDFVTAAKARYPWLTLKSPAVHHLKTELEYHVDLSRYDYVLYLDCDVLVNSGRLPDLIAALSQERAIVVQQDVIAVSSGAGFAGGQILSKVEQKRWGDVAVNAGVVGFPMTPIGRRFLRDWRQLNVDQKFRSRDQGNMIALLLRKYYGQWGYLADAAMGRALKRYPHTFVHFTTHKKALMEDFVHAGAWPDRARSALTARSPAVFAEEAFHARPAVLGRGLVIDLAIVGVEAVLRPRIAHRERLLPKTKPPGARPGDRRHAMWLLINPGRWPSGARCRSPNIRARCGRNRASSRNTCARS